MKRFLFLPLFFIVGCSPSKEVVTQSKVNVVVRKEFNDTNFQDGGKTGECDAWGRELLWSMDKGIWNYGLYVRSCGYDGLPYTDDDIVAKALMAIPRDEGVSEGFVRGLSRGFTKGMKEGLQADTKPTTKPTTKITTKTTVK